MQGQTTRQLAEQIFAELLALEPAARAARLAEACAGRDVLRTEVQALLDAAADGSAYFDGLRRRLGMVHRDDDMPPGVETDQFAPPARPLEAAPGAMVGPYRLVGELGSGGMGSVWLAERSDLLQRRQVALKLPHPAPGGWRRTGLAERMAREREILATLEHPNIARLYDAGVTPEGQPWLALELVRGERIDVFCRRRALPLRDRLQLFVQMARAVAHAHAQLVVHRDLKPANVLVTEAGDVKLLDFGIAKLVADGQEGASPGLAEETALTRDAGRVLTPDYASPEQILGRPIGTASDVYSLGVVLFELLADVRPYRLPRATPAALEEAIAAGVVQRPSALAPPARRNQLRGDLDTIVLKALKREPAERYATVAEFAEDVRRHLAHEPVLARPDSAAYRLRTFVRRHRLSVGAGAAVVAAVLAGFGVALWQMQVAREQERRASQALGFLSRVFREADPTGPAPGRAERPSAADLLTQARARVDSEFPGQPDVRVEVLNTLAESLLGVQDADAADETSAAALRESLAWYGEQHAQTLRARAARVRLHRLRYEPPKWRAELEAALPLLRAQPARHAQLTMQAWIDLANLEIAERKLEQAEATALAALAEADRLGGTWGPQRAALWEAIAVSRDFRQQFGPAAEAAEQAVRHAEAAWAGHARHPQVVNARMVRARAMMFGPRPADAVVQLEPLLEDAAALWGPRSRTVAQYTQVLAYAHVRAGQLEKAALSAPRALELMRGQYPAESLHVAAAIDSLAFVHLQSRRPEAALPLYEQLLNEYFQAPALREQALTAHMRRALMQAWQGRFEQALPELRRVVDEYGRVGRGSLMAPLLSLAQAERLDGKPALALELLSRAQAAVREGPQATRDRAVVSAETGITLHALGRHAEAEPLLREALAAWDGMGLAPTPTRQDAVQALGQVLLAQGRAAAALPLLAEADAYWRRADATSPSAGEAAFWHARALHANAATSEANAALQRALPALRRSPLPSHRTLALAGASLAREVAVAR